MNQFAQTPEPPYYAVIFTSRRSSIEDGYAETAERMLALAAQIDGFLGVESVREPNQIGITVSYWRDENAVAAWKAQTDTTAWLRRAARAPGMMITSYGLRK